MGVSRKAVLRSLINNQLMDLAVKSKADNIFMSDLEDITVADVLSSLLVNIIDKSDVTTATSIEVNNREELRYLNLALSSSIEIIANREDKNDFYATIVCLNDSATPISTAADLVAPSSNVRVINPDLEIEEFTVLHITLFYDGISICANVGGYYKKADSYLKQIGYSDLPSRSDIQSFSVVRE